MRKIDKIIAGLQIFAKYEKAETAAEHDVFYAGPPRSAVISAEDVEKLKDLGWFFESEVDSWAIFT